MNYLNQLLDNVFTLDLPEELIGEAFNRQVRLLSGIDPKEDVSFQWD